MAQSGGLRRRLTGRQDPGHAPLEMPDPKDPRLLKPSSDDPLSLYSSEHPLRKFPEFDANAIPASVRPSSQSRQAAASTPQGPGKPLPTSLEAPAGFETSEHATGRTMFEWPKRETPAPPFFHAPPKTAADKVKPLKTSAGALLPRDKIPAMSPVSGTLAAPIVAGDSPTKAVAPQRQPEAVPARDAAAVAPLTASRPNRVRRLAVGFALVALLLTATALMLRTRAQPAGPAETDVASDVKETRPDSRAPRLEPAVASRAIGVTGAAPASRPSPPVAAAAASSKSASGPNPAKTSSADSLVGDSSKSIATKRNPRVQPPDKDRLKSASASLPSSSTSSAKLQAGATAPPAASSPQDTSARKTVPVAKATGPDVASSRLKPESAAGTAGRYKGSLQVATQPAGAQVFIDRQMVGVSPVAVSDLAAGSHVVRIELEGYERWSSSVQVVTSKSANLNVNLRRVSGR
jgi:PEGA domain-containing protein